MKLIYQTPIIKFTVGEFAFINAANEWFTDLSQEEYDAIADHFGRESLDKLNDLLYSFTSFMEDNLENDEEEEDTND
jgi:hypothetical protein